jgi:glycerol-3-phosphate acyltransferase PlsY
MTPTAIAILIGAYLLGAIPFGLIIASRFAGVDVRAKGSGNIGATNVARTAGKKLGIFTLFLDGLKGAAPVLLAEHVFHQPLLIVALSGLAAVLGHVFPIYLKLKGGKGVATGAGAFLALAPIPTLIAAAVFLAVYAVAKVVSLGSLLASIVLVGAIVYLDGRREVVWVASAIVLLILVRHRGNIERIIKRTENKV